MAKSLSRASRSTVGSARTARRENSFSNCTPIAGVSCVRGNGASFPLDSNGATRKAAPESERALIVWVSVVDMVGSKREAGRA